MSDLCVPAALHSGCPGPRLVGGRRHEESGQEEDVRMMVPCYHDNSHAGRVSHSLAKGFHEKHVIRNHNIDYVKF